MSEPGRRAYRSTAQGRAPGGAQHPGRLHPQVHCCALPVLSHINMADGKTGAALLPMDGYHLDNGPLANRRLGQAGAPRTFMIRGDFRCHGPRPAGDGDREILSPALMRPATSPSPIRICIGPVWMWWWWMETIFSSSRIPGADRRQAFAITVFLSPGLESWCHWLHGPGRAAVDLRRRSIRVTREGSAETAELVLANSGPADVVSGSDHASPAWRQATGCRPMPSHTSVIDPCHRRGVWSVTARHASLRFLNTHFLMKRRAKAW